MHLLALLAMPTCAPAASVYVATDGNDTWSGTLAERNAVGDDGPFATLSHARDEVRERIADGLAEPVTVTIRGGTYILTEPLVFSPEDSGTKQCPITYAAADGERVVITGARQVAGWREWRDGAMVADLKTQGLEGVQFHQLFYRGTRQPLARHPDKDATGPRNGGVVYAEDAGYQPRQELVYAEGDIPFSEWGDISQAEVVSTYGGGWSTAIVPIESVDPEQRLITTAPVRVRFYRLNRFYVQNVLDALDSPGEWFLDYQTSLLYFMPPEGELADGDVTVPAIDHLITLEGSLPYPHGYLNVKHRGSRDDYVGDDANAPETPVEHLHFRGLRLEGARQDGFRLVGARNCSVTACSVTNVGGVGINLGGVTQYSPEVGNPRLAEPTGFAGGVGGAGQDCYFNAPCESCRVVGCDVSHVGSDGIFLYGTGNVAENSHVYDTGLHDKDCAGVNLWGEGNVARRNALHDVPRNAVYLKGIGNVVELNDIHHTMLETCDGGAIRTCQRNVTLRGNIIRHNRIVDTVGFGHQRGGDQYFSPYYSWGIYLDDFTCGTTVQGNLIVRTGRGGVMLHGGSDNLVEGNIIVDAGDYQVEIAPIRDDPVSGNLVRSNVLVCAPDRLPYRCTKCVPGAVSFATNLVWTGGDVTIDLGAGGKRYEGWHAWLDADVDKGSQNVDPGFADPQADDYTLPKNSPAWQLGFQPIPFDEIGCYADAARASWPLQVDAGLVREGPVLYSAPPRPLQEDFEREQPGRPPWRGDIAATKQAPIVVTEEHAAAGTRSLKLVDAPGLAQVWQPRIFWPLRFEEGAVRFTCDLRLDGERPPVLYIDPRQYSDTGGREYFSGPMLQINQQGEITAGQPRQVIATVPFDTWFRLELTMSLGQAAGSSEMLLTVGDQEPQQLIVPHASPDFARLERVVVASLTDGESVFYLDNVSCVPIE